MATFKSRQLNDEMPIPSHGDASSVKCQRFLVQTGGAIGTSDVIQFGYLPHYAKVVDAVIISDVAITVNVGDSDDPDRLYAAAALTANTPVRMTAGTGFRMEPQLEARMITGAATVASGAATKLELFIHYVVENDGVGYP